MKDKKRTRIYDIVFILILICALFLRVSGNDWDEVENPHPDERFLSMVTSALSPVETLSQYFDTHTSSLNPNNRGYDFFVYGTAPLFITRYVSEWTDLTGYGNTFTVGRYLSAMSDVIVVFLVYLITRRLYNERVALFAGIFSAFTVLEIQLSHFYVVDPFTNLFVIFTIYIAVLISTQKKKIEINQDGHQQSYFKLNWSLAILFGIGFGLSMASKLSAFPVALLLPLAVLIQFWEMPVNQKKNAIWQFIAYFAIGAFVSLITFRIAQPYAFDGPSFFNFSINQKWWSAISTQQSQAAGAIDWPPSIQWARRSKLFSFKNLSIWGLGIPMSVVAWGGVVFAAIKMYKDKLKNESRKHLILWAWTVAYFLWQSMAFNPTMRYQLHIYAPLAIFAGWCVNQLLDIPFKNQSNWIKTLSIAGKIIASIAIIGTIIYGVAFANIYSEEEPRHAASKWIYQNVPGAITIPISISEIETYNQQIGIPTDHVFQNGIPYTTSFLANESGEINEISLYKLETIDLIDPNNQSENVVHVISIKINDNPSAILLPQIEDGKTGYSIQLEQPISIQENMLYQIEIIVNTTDALKISGASPINETNWDMGLPFRVENYDPFTGLYRNDLNLDIYADGSEEKRDRFISMLNEGDYIFISSSRQWGSLPRIPERYPLSDDYYRALMGCPEDLTIEKCYNIAELGMFTGALGYELVHIAENPPHIGNFIINDQASEEAFTVYDHPKSFIFRKSENYNSQFVADFFNGIDISNVTHLIPKQATDTGLTPEQARVQPNLMLTEEQAQALKDTGTWSELFDSNKLINKNQFIGVIVWLLILWFLSLTIYPITRLLFSNLPDKGYPIARIAGMTLLSVFAWLFANIGFSYSRFEILVIWIVLLIISAICTAKHWNEIKEEFKKYWKYYLIIEMIFLGIFILGVLIRLGNPDLWHTSKGGEKPMDFAYFNAVLKNNSFPVYDPWFSGGYLNYYYFGFVLVGTLVKLLGIVPSFAYNLIMPTVLAILALGGFSLSWNIYLLNNQKRENTKSTSPFLVGAAGATFLSIIGNMGMFQLLISGFSKLGALKANITFETANAFQKIWWSIQGFFFALVGDRLPYYLSDYYWWPGRVIRAVGETEPITEFPFFTFIYADPHAHFFSLAVVTLALTIIISILISLKKGNSIWKLVSNVIFVGLTIAVIYMTNTWDYPVYLALATLAIIGCIMTFYKPKCANKNNMWQTYLEKGIVTFLTIGILFFSFKFFTHFYDFWNVTAYSSIKPWTGQTTSTGNYLTHWLLFLVILITWLIWETRQVLANTPARFWNTIKENLWAVIGIPVFTVIAIIALWIVGNVKIAWIVVPLGIWITLLLLTKKFSLAKQIGLFFAGSALFLTIMVEVIVLDGDIARMNTVFKFYLQSWTLFAIVSAAALGWILEEINLWKSNWQKIFNASMVILVFIAMLFPVIGTSAKIQDRMAKNAPRTLDGMTYMEYANYYDQDQMIEFDEDYRLIKWMQENIHGTPTIVEAQIPEYRWGSRISINTGLPTVLGWNWHQRQQRGILQDAEVWQRSSEIASFYDTLDSSYVNDFIEKYNIDYIVVGQLERAYHDAFGIDKFSLWEDDNWEMIYHDNQTTLYKVIK